MARKAGARFPVGADSSLRHFAQSSFGANPDSYLTGTEYASPGGKAAEA
jgi:hypothetical protein